MASANVRPWGTGSPEPSTWPRLMGEPAEQDDQDQAGPSRGGWGTVNRT